MAYIGLILLLIFEQVVNAVASYLVQAAGHWVLATLVSLQIFSGVSDPIQTMQQELPITSAAPCHPESSGNYFVNLGMDYVDDECDVLHSGWKEAQQNRGDWDAPNNDRSRLVLPNSQDSNGSGQTGSITLYDIQPGVEYTLAFAVLIGDYEDSFRVYLADQEKPVFGVDAEAGVAYDNRDIAEQAINIFSLSLPSDVTSRAGQLTIKFENVSNNPSSHTAFYYLWLGPTISQEAAIQNASPHEKTCLQEVPDVEHYDFGNPKADFTSSGWYDIGKGEPDDIYGDKTTLRQSIGSDNHAFVPVCALSGYKLTVAWRNGNCKYSFEIYVNDEKIASIVHDPNKISARPEVKTFDIPRQFVNSGEMDINFRNTSSTECGTAAIWYVNLQRQPDHIR